MDVVPARRHLRLWQKVCIWQKHKERAAIVQRVRECPLTPVQGGGENRTGCGGLDALGLRLRFWVYGLMRRGQGFEDESAAERRARARARAPFVRAEHTLPPLLHLHLTVASSAILVFGSWQQRMLRRWTHLCALLRLVNIFHTVIYHAPFTRLTDASL